MTDFFSQESDAIKPIIKRLKEKPPSSYIEEAKVHIRRNDYPEAYRTLQAAWVTYPHHPQVLSFYGSLHAIVGKKYRAGIEHCTKAISAVVRRGEIEGHPIFPELYLNLGRAYLAADRRKEALSAFFKGLRYDKKNRALLKEVEACERRARPPLPFLDRSNVLNKYTGLALRRNLNRK